jgi:hypothetical protein
MIHLSALKLARAKEDDPYLIIVSALCAQDALADDALRKEH